MTIEEVREALRQTQEKIGALSQERHEMAFNYAMGRGPYVPSNGRVSELHIRAIELRILIDNLERRSQPRLIGTII